MSASTDRQTVMNIVRDMEPGDAIQIARSIIDGVGAKAVIWVEDDIDTVLDEYFTDVKFTDEERENIKERVTDTYEWRSLDDASNEDWEKINQAVWEASRSLGIDLNRVDA